MKCRICEMASFAFSVTVCAFAGIIPEHDDALAARSLEDDEGHGVIDAMQADRREGLAAKYLRQERKSLSNRTRRVGVRDGG